MERRLKNDEKTHSLIKYLLVHMKHVGVFGGMILATFVATIFIPLFFTLLSGKHVRQHGHVPEIESENKSE